MVTSRVALCVQWQRVVITAEKQHNAVEPNQDQYSKGSEVHGGAYSQQLCKQRN